MPYKNPDEKAIYAARKERDPDYLAKKREYHRNYRESRSNGSDPLYNARQIYYQARYRAKKIGVPFDLDWPFLEALWTGKCELSGIPFNTASAMRSAHICLYSPSLDRIDPDTGYVKGNVRWILNAINSFKIRGTDDDIMFIARAMLEHAPTTGGVAKPTDHPPGGV